MRFGPGGYLPHSLQSISLPRMHVLHFAGSGTGGTNGTAMTRNWRFGNSCEALLDF
jgi:hypothetical protein